MNTPPDEYPQAPDHFGFRPLDEAVSKVILFGEDGTPRARRAHPADRVTDNRATTFRRNWNEQLLGRPATHFTEAER